MTIFDILTILVGGLFFVWLADNFIKSRNRAPGPLRLPLIGTLHAVVKNGRRHKPPFQLLQELSAIYGPIMSLKIGLVEQVVVTDFELIKEVLTSDVWVDRYEDPYIMERSGGRSLGIIFINGDVWKEMRRFTTRTLRDFGFGRQKSMESVISEELDDLKCRLNKTLGESERPIALKQFFTVSVLNILWSMIAGHRFSHDNERLLELIDLIDTMSKAFPITASIITAYPFLRFFHRKLTQTGRARVAFRDKIQNFFRELLEERRQLGQYKNVQKDFVDVFLNEIDNHKNQGSGDDNYYTDEQFILVTLDLFLAGSETTSNTLEFAFLRMMLHPQIQANVQKEIDLVVGRERMPTNSDRAMMPYTDAVLLEIQRLSNVIPMVVRSPTQQTKVGPYDVPKGVLCVLNTYAWHMDEKYWPDPLEFKPQRFLDNSGTSVVNAHKILPFGSGKRVCLGEVLAKATTFTYFTTLLQSYNFQVSPHHPKPTAQPDIGFTLSPHPYFAKITPRKI